MSLTISLGFFSVTMMGVAIVLGLNRVADNIRRLRDSVDQAVDALNKQARRIGDDR